MTAPLVVAFGAVTVVPTGASLSVLGGSDVDDTAPERGLRIPKDGWVDVAVSGETSRMRDGEKASIGGYRVRVVRCFRVGIPGDYECVAISRDQDGLHDGVERSARVLGDKNKEFVMTLWPQRSVQAAVRWAKRRSPVPGPRPWWTFW